MLAADRYIQGLAAEGRLLASAASELDPGAEIPTCPGWTVRDLVRHTAGIHRWCGENVRGQLRSLLEVEDLKDLYGKWPADEELIEFYLDELALLIKSLEEAPDDLQCATFMVCDSPKIFWCRRQMQETTVHRVDVELVSGSLTPIDPELASDGVDEMLTGFVPRRFMKLRSDDPISIRIDVTDTGRSWRLDVSNEPTIVTRDNLDDADCIAQGRAEDLFLTLWNRPGRERLHISGRSDGLDLFQERIQIR